MTIQIDIEVFENWYFRMFCDSQSSYD